MGRGEKKKATGNGLERKARRRVSPQNRLVNKTRRVLQPGRVQTSEQKRVRLLQVIDLSKVIRNVM